MTRTEIDIARKASFGQTADMTVIDRAGVWLSEYQIRRSVGSLAGKDVADFGCGFEATHARSYLHSVRSATLVDVALAEDLKQHPKVRAIEGYLPDSLGGLADQSLDVILLMSVIEHLVDPLTTLVEAHRLLRPGGICAINVPTWRGKRPLEFIAFRLGISTDEMDDHKTYYDPRDLWPLLVKAGFTPHGIKCFKHKFTMCTFAVCRIDAG
jgi:SAM-dependent methyltransferase